MSVIASVHGELPPHRYTQSEITQAVIDLPGYDEFESSNPKPACELQGPTVATWYCRSRITRS